MGDKHRKSKRSLNGEDVYESACKYDVGWTKSKESRSVVSDGECQCDKQSKNERSVEAGEDQQRGEQNVSHMEIENEKKTHTSDKDGALSTHRKTLDFGKVKRRKRTSVEVDIIDDPNLHPLHTKWNFTKKELTELKKKGVKIRMGQWSKKEIKILENNMNEYLKANNIKDPTPLILAEDGRRGKGVKNVSTSTNFYRSLGKGIDRPLFLVYRRVIRMYNPEQHAGRWSEADSEALLRFHSKYGDRWTKIGSLLGRSGMSVHHRFLELQRTHVGLWSEEEVERLDAAVRVSTGTENGSQIYGTIDWGEVENFVMTRTSEQCRWKWMKDVCWKTRGANNWTSEDDIKLIERLYKASEADENDVNWVQLTKGLPNSPSVSWLRSKWNMLKKAVPNYTECDFEELLDYLYNKHRPFLEKNIADES